VVQELSMRRFSRVCLELSVVLVVAALTGLVSGWALPLAGLVLLLGVLTVLIERERQLGLVDDLPLAADDPDAGPVPEPDPAPAPSPASLPLSNGDGAGALVAYRPAGGLAVLAPPVVTATFRMPDIGQAQAVALVGEFNDWSATEHPMTRAGDAWVACVVLRRGRTYRYRYLLDGSRWENDWSADAYVPNEFGGEDSVLDLTGDAD
jgi:hypothetical protein